MSFPVPSSRHELQHFLGMAGYYRRFCKNFSAVTAPLTDLLSPKVKFARSSDCQHAFECIKALSFEARSHPCRTCVYVKLAVDACGTGAGRALMGWSTQCVIFKKGLTDTKKCTPTSKRRLCTGAGFEVYLGSSNYPITIYTDHDHNPLIFLNEIRNTNQWLMHWALLIQAFNLDVKHVHGKDNILADALSHSFCGVE